jgi:anti-sigma regulatory factor (Ser/Thr protein kinase)
MAMNRATGDEPVTLVRQRFTSRHLRRLRQLVDWAARLVGLDTARGDDLALAVTEAASNVIRHGGGTGQLELIKDDNRALIAQISDHGPGMPADAATAVPSPEHTNGRGLYLIQRYCDRVAYRTGSSGTTVHLEIDIERQHG